MNLYTFGKNKCDVCLVEELIELNDSALMRRVSRVIHTTNEILASTTSSSPKFLIHILKNHCFHFAENKNIKSHPKIFSYLKCSINSKINDWAKLQ